MNQENKNLLKKQINIKRLLKDKHVNHENLFKSKCVRILNSIYIRDQTKGDTDFMLRAEYIFQKKDFTLKFNYYNDIFKFTDEIEFYSVILPGLYKFIDDISI